MSDLIESETGRVYWITGLSGAGKSTLGHLLYEYLKGIRNNVVLLDGDILRGIFGGGHGHTIEERKTLASRYSRLCQMLSDQGIDVVIATISMFRVIREWNRSNINKYTEIYLEVPIDILVKRDQKQLYSRALRGEVKNVMGVDVDVEEPENPDVILRNDGSRSPAEILDALKQAIPYLGE